MAAPDWMFDSTAAVLRGILPLFYRRAGAIADATAEAAYRKTLGRLLTDTRAATRSSSLVADLAAVVSGYRLAAANLRAAIAGLERVVVAVRALDLVVAPRTSVERRRQQHELALAGLIEVLAAAEIGNAVARLRLDSYDEARAMRARLARLFDLAIERAAERGDIDAATALRACLGALTRDLIERGRPLARIATYETPTPLPAVVLAWSLYQDAGRADELRAENPGHDHPAFMPMTGRARTR